MIASKYRLRDYEVERVFKRWRPFFWRLWTLNVLSDTRSQYFRMAIGISRKHDKRSVWRNRYRRSIYDALLPELKKAMNASDGSSFRGAQCVFMLKKWFKLTDSAVQLAIVWDAIEVFHKALNARS